jgi:hypothetical protein
MGEGREKQELEKGGGRGRMPKGGRREEGGRRGEEGRWGGRIKEEGG